MILTLIRFMKYVCHKFFLQTLTSILEGGLNLFNITGVIAPELADYMENYYLF
jgi:hypothetical protein